MQRERQCQRGTLAFATGGAVRCGIAGQSEALQEFSQALFGLPWLDTGQAGVCRQGVCCAQQQALAQSGGGGQLRFLGTIAELREQMALESTTLEQLYLEVTSARRTAP